MSEATVDQVVAQHRHRAFLLQRVFWAIGGICCVLWVACVACLIFIPTKFFPFFVGGIFLFVVGMYIFLVHGATFVKGLCPYADLD